MWTPSASLCVLRIDISEAATTEAGVCKGSDNSDNSLSCDLVTALNLW